MTNGSKYKTAQERAEAFYKFCSEIQHNNCAKCQIGGTSCKFEWLDLEAEEEKPLPCPFCGNECETEAYYLGYAMSCVRCGYRSELNRSKEESIAAHNRVAKKCTEVNE